MPVIRLSFPLESMVKVDEMQFGFMPGKGTIDAVFILRRLQEEYLDKEKKLYRCFVDLEKAFDRVPRKVLERTSKEDVEDSSGEGEQECGLGEKGIHESSKLESGC